jgi:chemotaxis methyl-accepting protein methylase
MDLAPRTGFREVPPESYQPWAVIDALVSTGFSGLDDLEVTAADINPRVVAHLRRSAATPRTLQLTTEIAAKEGVSFSRDYREYFDALGARLSRAAAPRVSEDAAGHLQKSVRVGADAAKVLRAEPLDIVTERLTGSPFDLVIATNILPYFDDQQLALAASNIAAMLAPGGLFLHNEARPILGELTAAFGLSFEQSRHAVIATVAGAPAPLFDSVFLHVRR